MTPYFFFKSLFITHLITTIKIVDETIGTAIFRIPTRANVTENYQKYKDAEDIKTKYIIKRYMQKLLL